MNIEIKDEILENSPKYRLRDGNGNIIHDNISIEQITPIIQEGTPINKELLENIQQQMFLDTRLLVAEYKLTQTLEEVTIEGLSLVNDGGIYDITFVGKTRQVAIKSDTFSTFLIASSNSSNFATVCNITIAKAGNTMVGVAIAKDSTDVSTKAFGQTTSATDMTSITFTAPSISSGTEIKIFKRR